MPASSRSGAGALIRGERLLDSEERHVIDLQMQELPN